MSDAAWLTLDGFDELEKQLQSLSIVAQKRILRTVVKEAAAPLLPKMIANFNGNWNNDTGQLVNSFAIRATIPKNATFADAFASVGVFKNRKVQDASGKEMDAPQIAYWLETGVDPHSLGTKARLSTNKGQKKGRKHPGIPAKPFIRPAFDSNIEQMLGTEKTLLSELIDKALKNAR